ncbi:hypothetical protein [Chthonobacter albigriseus]|uniref:hypothetical protein n=1 Tax=Chthonobacter albigriseus TaxID=1683161 RepID=UPI0015EE3F84|nr:hypothetical protein [Chthonobacter albigriseus]
MHLSGFVGRLPAAAAALLLGLGSAAVAGEMVDRATQAETLLSEQKPVQALAEIEAAFNAAWDKAPLGFSEALFVAARPQGFGIYEARATNVFAPGEDMFVYAEPFGYGYGEADGQFAIGFDADFELRTTKGQILHAQEGFAAPGLTTRRRNKEFQVFITYNFKGLKAGDYVLVTRLRDKNSDKKGSFELPFSVKAP